MNQTFVLRGQSFVRILANLIAFLSRLPLDRAWQVTIAPFNKGRTVEQNSRLHAMCADVAEQREWAGRRLDTEGWKRLFVDAWARETGKDGGKVVPSLDAQSVVVLNRSTRAMNVGELSELMEWIAAWCAEHDVTLNDMEAA